MPPRNHPDRIGASFDDHRLVANAGLFLPATLDQHLACGNCRPSPRPRWRAGAGQHGSQRGW